MQIERQQALAVVDHYTIAFKEQRLGQDHAPAIYGCDRGSAGHAEIEALMSALDRTVEHALDSKRVGDLGIYRRCKRSLPFALGTQSFESFGFRLLVLFDLALVFGAGRCVARGNLQRHAGIALAFYPNFLFERDRSRSGLPRGSFGMKFQRSVPRLGFQANSGESEP